MKHLRGHARRYFSLATIAMYSTLQQITTVETNQQYHLYAYKLQEYKTSPPVS